MLSSNDLSALDEMHVSIAAKLSALGDVSPYISDANEPDPRYLAYGVRAPEMKRLVAQLTPSFSELCTEQSVALATSLIGSGYGEKKTVALALLERIPDHFSPDRFDLLESLFRDLRGWSKIDAFTGSFLH